jgi:broad specificity phosphatase PhoE
MTIKVTLLACGATRMAREGGFADPHEPLDEGGRRKVEALSKRTWDAAHTATSTSAAAMETARLLRLQAVTDHRLDDQFAGAWQGRSLAQIAATEQEGLATWLAAPQGGAPGGETFDELTFRVTPWLAAASAEASTSILAVTHSMAIRAALCAALGVAPATAMRIDLGPLTAVVLSFNRVWRLQALAPADALT